MAGILSNTLVLFGGYKSVVLGNSLLIDRLFIEKLK